MEYKVETIWDSAVYIRESESGHLSGLYSLISWKGYPEKKNTWKPVSAVQHFRKLINLFDKDHLNKPTATSSTIDTTSPISRPIVRPTKPLKQKRGWPTRCVKKCVKWGDRKVATRRNPSQCSSKARNRQVARDLSP